MTKLKRLEDHNRFYYGCMSKKKWEDANALSIKLGFFIAQEGDELVDPDYFVWSALGKDRLILSCVNVEEPKQKKDKKNTSATSNSDANLFDFFTKACLDESIPLHHGYIQEIRVLILRGKMIRSDKMEIIKEIENCDTFLVPTELVNHFKSMIIQVHNRIEIEGPEIEKGKYPPFENNDLTLAQ